jgi:hypothetical protein
MSKTPQLPEELQGLTFPQLLALAEKPQSQQMVDSSRADISGRHLLSANSSAMLDQYILYQVQKQSMGHAEECTQEELEELHHLQDVADSIRKRQMSDGHPADMSAAVSMAPQPTSAAPHAGVPAARTASTTTTQKTKGLFSLFFCRFVCNSGHFRGQILARGFLSSGAYTMAPAVLPKRLH